MPVTDIGKRLLSLWDTRPPHTMAVLLVVLLVIVLTLVATAVGDWSIAQ
jgi:hypothetical protein